VHPKQPRLFPRRGRTPHVGDAKRILEKKAQPIKGESQMKSPVKKVIHAVSVAFAMLVVACFTAVNASAQCGASDGHLASNTATAMLLRSAAKASKASAAQAGGVAPVGAAIVGFWHVTFISKGTGFIPDGTVVDMGFSQWHSDGTEILNSSRPPATSNFCLGVWEKTGPSTYKLNHFALSSDLNGNMVGPGNIRENVTLGPQGTTYTGTFSIDQYDTSRNLLAHIVGEVKATRITVDTKISDIL
jgi:hypothetical protein